MRAGGHEQICSSTLLNVMPRRKAKRSKKSNGSRKSAKRVSIKERSRKPKKALKGLAVTEFSAPAAQAFIQGWKEPKFKHRSSSGCRVEHVEYLTDIAGYTTYGEAGSFNQWAINPGRSSVFEWLSGIALDFEQYRFHKFDVYYLPSTGSSTPGTVAIAPDYDPNDVAVTTGGTVSVSQQELLNFQDRQVGVAWSALRCRFDPRAMFPTGPRKYVSAAAVEPFDARLVHAALLDVAAYQAAADNTTFGKIFLHYDCEFWVPAKDGGLMGGPCPAIEFYNTTSQPYANGVVQNLGDTGTWTSRGLSAGISMGTDGTILLPEGWWKVSVKFDASGGAANLTSLVADIQYNSILRNGYTFSPSATAAIVQSAYLQALVYSTGDAYLQVRVVMGGAGVLTVLIDSGSILLERL